MNNWILIVGGLALILIAGYAATTVMRRRRRIGDLDTESASARRAIRLAEAARDAGTVDVPGAERLYNRAQALMSGVPNAATARKAAKMARQAEGLWNRQNPATPDLGSSPESPASFNASADAPEQQHVADGSRSGRRSKKQLAGADRYAAAIAAQPKIDGADVLKIACVALLGLIGLIFIANQTQQANVTFTGQDSRSLSLDAITPSEPPPSYAEIVEQYGDAPIVTLPGATAVVDTAIVREWMAKADAERVVLAPPLHPGDDGDNMMSVPDDVVLVVGTYSNYGILSTYSSDFTDMQEVFAARDVTTSVVTLLAHSLEEEAADGLAEVTWREPSTEELTPVVNALEADGIAFVGDVEPFEVPEQAAKAYPEDESPLIVVAPYAMPGQPAVNYADAVAAQFPDRPVVAMTGLWINFAGPYADEFETPLVASFYGQFGERLEKHAYSQETVLKTALSRVEQFRYSGIFDQPLPYQAPDPLQLTLPALPWICGALGLAAVVASIVQITRQKLDRATPAGADALHRLAGLSELAVEVSGLTEGRSKAALVRATSALTEARDVVDRAEEDAEVVDELLDRADRALTSVAEQIGRDEYRPTAFLAGRWS